MVGEVGLGASLATIKPPAECGGAARKHALHRPVMGGAEVVAVGLGVTCPMRREEVGQSEGHGFSFPLNSGQGGEGSSGFFITHFGEVEINHGWFKAGVTQVS